LGFSNWPVIFASSTNANKLSGTIIKFFGALPGTEVEEAPTSTRPHQVFWCRCQGGRRLLQGEFSHAHPLLCFKFCFTLFLLASSFLSKIQKN
jgi:hypothetical protein